ncbi:MAG: sortase [Anaerolineae bacterium]|nr:sortase [Anaerolineae bacterium]
MAITARPTMDGPMERRMQGYRRGAKGKRWLRTASLFPLMVGIVFLLAAAARCGSTLWARQRAQVRLTQAMPTPAALQEPVVTPTPVAMRQSTTPPPTATPQPTTTTPTPTVEAAPPPTLTPMFAPTAGLTPDPLPARPPAAAISAEVMATSLNVRAGPGTTFRRLGGLSLGQQVAVLARNPEGTWLLVCCVDGQQGWVSAEYVKLSQPMEAIAEATVIPSAPPAVPVRIVIPDLGIDAPVEEVGWRVEEVRGELRSTWEMASFAAGHHSNSALPGQPGNVVISGHHNIEGKVFKNISLAWDEETAELQEDGITKRSHVLDGYTITLYDAAGRTFRYIIEGMYNMPDRDVSEEQRRYNARFIAPTSEPLLTLVTCWPYTNNTHRIVVVARLAEEQR